MPATHGNNDTWLGQQLAQMKKDIAALKARTATLASVTTGLFLPAKAYWANANGTAFTAGAILPFDTIAFDDTGGAMKTGAAAGFVAPVAGRYWVASGLAVTSTASGQGSYSQITSGATTRLGGSDIISSGAGEGLPSVATGLVECAAGDKIQVVYQGTNGLLGSGNTEDRQFLCVMRVA